MIDLVLSVFTFSGISRILFHEENNLSIRRICHLTTQHKLAKMEPRQNCAFVFSEFMFLFCFDLIVNFPLNSMALRKEEVCYCLFPSILFPKKSLYSETEPEKKFFVLSLFHGKQSQPQCQLFFSKEEMKYRGTTLLPFHNEPCEGIPIYLVICTFLVPGLNLPANKSAFVKYLSCLFAFLLSF